MKKRLTIFIITLCILLNGTMPCSPKEEGPDNQIKVYEGLFGMCGPANPLDKRLKLYEQAFQKSPWLNGMMVLIGWKDIQPTPDEFDWSETDSLVNLASKYNRKVSLCFFSIAAPDWIYAQGVDKFYFTDANPHHKDSYGKKRAVPMPLSEEFYKLWAKFIQEAGKRYDSNPAVCAVVVIGVNFSSGEIYIPLRNTEELTQARQFNITADNVVRYWQKYIDLYAKSFPTTRCKMHIAEIFKQDKSVLDRVVAYGAEKYPRQFMIQTNKLSGKKDQQGQHEYDLIKRYSSQITVGFQMLSTFKDKERQGSMVITLANGIRAGAKYYELWFGDAVDENVSQIFYDLWQQGQKVGWQKLMTSKDKERSYTTPRRYRYLYRRRIYKNRKSGGYESANQGLQEI